VSFVARPAPQAAFVPVQLVPEVTPAAALEVVLA